VAKPQPWLVPAVIAGGLSPLVVMGVRALNDGLGSNPVDTALNQLGKLSLIFLVASLACTPAQRLFQWTWAVRIRKTVGLLAFATVCLHLLVYVGLDQGLDLGKLWEDVRERPFVTVGFIAWLLLVPLAITSTGASVRRLGFARWKKLHRLAYVCGALGVLHFYLRVKKDHTEPVLYGVVLAALLAVRLLPAQRPAAR
jgi:sulfoxide reductase heme-binding subunit YedZ